MKKVLTIAGSDSGGGAGIQADLKTFTVHRVYGASVITSVTAQNTLGVDAVNNLSADFVAAQLDSVLKDIKIDALKTGMLGTKEIVEITAEKIAEYKLNNLVVDPVMVASSGDLLLERDAVEVYKEKLFPLAELITPNLMEAKVLTGRDPKKRADTEKLAEELIQFGSSYVLIKGGHSAGDTALDLLYDGSNFKKYESEYIDTQDTHGTGCTLSAAAAANLAQGYSVEKAAAESKQFITEAIKSGFKVGGGMNPVNHFVDF